MIVSWIVTILGYTCGKEILASISLVITNQLGNHIDRQDNKRSRLKMYLVPNVDNPIVRIPIWQETQTFETHDWRLHY